MAGIQLTQGVTTYNAAGASHPAAITIELAALCYLSFVGGTTTSYTWILTRPVGSRAVLSSTISAGPSFMPDIDGGEYSIELIDNLLNAYVLDVVLPTLPILSGATVNDFDVRRYGAAGNGTLDDTTAVQTAIDAAAALVGNNTAGGVVYFPPGEYRITAGLTCTRGITIRGAGRNRSLIRYTGSSATTLLQFTGAFGATVNDIGFQTTVDNLAHVYLRLLNCSYFELGRLSCGVTAPTNRNKVTGVLIEGSGTGHVPPIGFGQIHDITYSVTDSSGAPAAAGSRGIHFKGVSATNVENILLTGHMNLENAEYGILSEFGTNIMSTAAMFLQGNIHGLGFISAQENLFLCPRIASSATDSINIDAGSINTTIMFPLFFGAPSGGHVVDNSTVGARTVLFGNGDSVSTDMYLRNIKIGSSGTAVGTTIKGHLSATTTWDPPSLNAGTQTTTTVTVTGAALGDEATASFSLDLQGMQLTATVSSADTVTVVLRNGTAGTLDILSGTLRASVWKH